MDFIYLIIGIAVLVIIIAIGTWINSLFKTIKDLKDTHTSNISKLEVEHKSLIEDKQLEISRLTSTLETTTQERDSKYLKNSEEIERHESVKYYGEKLKIFNHIGLPDEKSLVVKIDGSIREYLIQTGYKGLDLFSAPENSKQSSDPDSFWYRRCHDYLRILPNSSIIILEVKVVDHNKGFFKNFRSEDFKKQNLTLSLLWNFGVPIHYAYDSQFGAITDPTALALKKILTSKPNDILDDLDKLKSKNHVSLGELLEQLLKSNNTKGEILSNLLSAKVIDLLDDTTTALLLFIHHENMIIPLSKNELKILHEQYKIISRQMTPNQKLLDPLLYERVEMVRKQHEKLSQHFDSISQINKQDLDLGLDDNKLSYTPKIERSRPPTEGYGGGGIIR